MTTNLDDPEPKSSTSDAASPQNVIDQAESTTSPHDLPDALRSPGNGSDLIDAASTAVRDLESLNTELPQRKAAVYANTIAALYPLTVAFSCDQQVRADVTAKFKVRQRKNTPDAVYVTQALIRSNGSKLPKTTENDIAKTIRSLVIAKVPENANAVRNWLNTPEDVLGDGTFLTGQSKAFAYLRKHLRGEIDAAAEARAKNRAKRVRERWDKFVAEDFIETPPASEEKGFMPVPHDPSDITILVMDGSRPKFTTVSGELAGKVRKALLSEQGGTDTQKSTGTVSSPGISHQTGGSDDE
jgi:hypothetical protein